MTYKMLSPRSVLKARAANEHRIRTLPSMADLPPWDRVSDIGFRCTDTARSDAAVRAKFERALQALNDERKTPASPTNTLPLPLAVRLRIYGHLVRAPRPIRMNPIVYTRPAWSPDAFDTLDAVLAPLSGALSASSALRAELLCMLFLQRSFHVVFSPYVRPSTCPLALAYMQRYGRLMQRVTLELDCTRLGYGRDAAAARLRPGTLHMDALVQDFVATQKQRPPGLVMDSLVVLCRRFYGTRPSPGDDAGARRHKRFSTSCVPYVGPEHEQVAQQLAALAGRVDAARLVGFSGVFSADLIRRLAAAHPDDHVTFWSQTPSNAYVLLPGQHAYLDCGPDTGVQLCPTSPRASMDTTTDASSTASLSPSRASTVTTATTTTTTTLPDKSEEKLAASLLVRALESVTLMQPRRLHRRRPMSVM